MAMPQILLFGFFEHSSVGRHCDRPTLAADVNCEFDSMVQQIFGSLPDEDEGCSQPYRNEWGVVSVDLWDINGNHNLVNDLQRMISATKCQIVLWTLFDSRFLSSAAVADHFDYYSGHEFRDVLIDWDRVRKENDEFIAEWKQNVELFGEVEANRQAKTQSNLSVDVYPIQRRS